MARNDGCLEGCETQKRVGGEKWNDELPDAGTRFIPAFRIVRAAHVSTHTTTTSYSEPSRITREPSSLYARRRMYATPVLPMFPWMGWYKGIRHMTCSRLDTRNRPIRVSSAGHRWYLSYWAERKIEREREYSSDEKAKILNVFSSLFQMRCFNVVDEGEKKERI